MEHHHRSGGGREPEPGYAGLAADETALTILRRYAAGEISSREAARQLGPTATEHDVFAGIRAAHLPLPLPTEAEIAAEIEGLRRLYGPHGPKPRG